MGKVLKVLSVGHSYVVAMNRSILRELAKDESFEVTIGLPKYFKGSLRPIEWEPEPEGSKLNIVPLDAYWTHQMHIFAYDHFQLKKLFSQKYDLVHAWEEPYIFAGYQIARMAHKTNTPYAFRTAQSLVKNYIYPFSYFEKKSFSWAKSWIAGGQLVFNAMVEKGLDPKCGEVLTLAVDTQKFKPMDDLEKRRQCSHRGFKAPLVGYLGRLSEEKGCDIIIKTFSALKNKHWNLLLMGSGPYEEKIRKWAEKENLSNRVHIQLFKHSEVPSVLPLCDLLIAPSQTRKFWKEQFGRMIVEAFASGVPVMASDSGEIPNVVGEAGVILPEADVNVWVEHIGDFVNQPKKYKEYSHLGLKRVEKFSAQSIAEHYKIFYQKLAQKN